jgi:primase-polymerase (primpol)-like protein
MMVTWRHQRARRSQLMSDRVTMTLESTLSGQEIPDRLFNEKDGNKWQAVYNGHWQTYYLSPSDADLGLLVKFAFYGGKDRQMTEALFSASPLSRILIRGTLEKPKRWKQPWANQCYRKRTLWLYVMGCIIVW